MKNTITLLLVLLICFGCNTGGDSPDTSDMDEFHKQKDTMKMLSKYTGMQEQQSRWMDWYIDKSRKVNKMLKMDVARFKNLSNDERTIMWRDQVEKMIEIYNEPLPEIPPPVIPKPSPLPDTIKPIKDKIKMQPRWRDVDSAWSNVAVATDTISMGGYIIFNMSDGMQIDTSGKMILLCSDTSSMNGFRSQRCFWMFGHFVSEIPRTNGILDAFDERTKIYYLDDRHLPLPKNIVVFLSKELK